MRNRSVSRWDPGVREEGARPKLHVMILYDDVVAGQRAMELFAYLTHEHEKEIELRPQIWRLDLALDPDWRDFLDEEARRATLFIIAMSGESSLPDELSRWLKSHLMSKRGTGAALVALLGQEGQMESWASARLQSLRSFADDAGAEFFAPAPAMRVVPFWEPQEQYQITSR